MPALLFSPWAASFHTCPRSVPRCALLSTYAVPRCVVHAVQVETAKLYQTAGVNPLAGCLPTLVTIPVFIGLYKSVSPAPPLAWAPRHRCPGGGYAEGARMAIVQAWMHSCGRGVL